MKKPNESANKKHKTPWPTLPVMQQIYKQQLWGTNGQVFYSGEGSHAPFIVEHYMDEVVKFLAAFENPPVVIDLGCGDFNIGRQLLPFASKYYAIDIVPELIAFNEMHYCASNLEFHCLDIAKGEWPQGDVVILRQVLQHLSNKEIVSIVQKLNDYKYIILTEHIPNKEFQPNKDIISGQGIRLKKHSGIDITSPPFNFGFQTKNELSRVDLGVNKGVILTEIFSI